MSEIVFEQINQYFHNRNFDRIPTDSSAVVMYGTFDSNYLYLINLIQLDDGYELDFERYLEYKQLTMEQFAGKNADKTILLNIVITDQIEAIYEVFNYTPDLNEPFIDVIWLVDKDHRELVIPKKQLKNIQRIEKDLKRLLKGEAMNHYDLNQRFTQPYTVYALVIINVLVWLLVEFMGSSTDVATLLRAGAIKYDLVVEQHQYYRLINAMFLHIGLAHLFHNMISLYIFGSRLEKFIKPFQFSLIYLGSGIIGSILSLVVAGISGVYAVSAGASGGVYGLMGSLLVVSLIRRRPIDGISTYILWLFFIMGVVYSFIMPGVDIFAHVGGFIGGLILTPIMLRSSRKTVTTEESL